MKNLFKFFLVLLMLSPSIIFAQAVTVTGVEGIVEVRPTLNDEWKVAYTGMEIPEGGSVRTAEKSRASIKFPNKAVVWMKENSALALRKAQPRSHQTEVEVGTIKVRVPHLKMKENFEVKCGPSVASIRGTVFTVDWKSLSQKPIFRCLFGELKLQTDVSGKIQYDLSVTQGNSSDGNAVNTLTQEEEKDGQENWDVGLTQEQRTSELSKQEQDRNSIRGYADGVIGKIGRILDDINKIKEEDIASGRDLTDIHGNKVRVEQRLERPDNNSLQVVNVVKRENGYSATALRRRYEDGGPVGGYNETATVGTRFDVVIAKLEFNEKVPVELNELPSFLQKDSVKLDEARLVFANNTDENNVFTMGFFGRRDPNSTSARKDDIISDLYVGTLKNDSASWTGEKKLFTLDVDNNKIFVSGNVDIVNYVNESGNYVSSGLTRFTKDGTGMIIDEPTNGEMYGFEAGRYEQVGNTSNKLWLVAEKFVFNKDGKIRNISDFTSSSESLDKIIPQTAAEVAIFAKQDNNGKPSYQDATNFLNGNSSKKNIDIVVIPDMGILLIQKTGLDQDKLKAIFQ